MSEQTPETRGAVQARGAFVPKSSQPQYDGETISRLAASVIAPTPNSTEITLEGLNAVNESYMKAERQLLAKVEEVIDMMSQHMIPSDKLIISFMDINDVYRHYEDVQIALSKIYGRMCMNHAAAKDRYKIWEAAKSDEVVEQYNLRTAESKKTWYSPTEIGNKVIAQNPEVYAKLKADIARAAMEEDFVKRMCDAWAGYQFVLQRMSKNSEAEAMASGVQTNAAKYDPLLGGN